MNIHKPKRHFVQEDLKINAWEDVKPYFEDLTQRELTTKADVEQWLKDKSELDAVLEEDAAWRYIRMTIDTRDEALSEAYKVFVTQIQPQLAPYEDQLNRKLMASEFVDEFKGEDYHIYFRSVKTALELYREENVALQAEIAELSQQFGSISAAQTIAYKGETLTMQKAATYLKDKDRAVRKEVYELMTARRAEDVEALNDLFTKLIEKRHQVALNAGFENFRDYKFQAMGRFDYTKEDCFDFHASIKKHIVPLVKEIQTKHKNDLGVDVYRPYDTEVDPSGKEALKPFEGGEELLQKSIAAMGKIDPYFADCIATMDEMKHLDLESKAGKSPGGYNYPLYEIGVPFIFMNAVGAQRDLVTMVHEGGHAVHSFLSRDLKLTGFKSLPSEVAELASMSMELLTMEHWDEFYKDEDELKRAKRDQLETILKILPWIATIDEYQHWIYENPTHSVDERAEAWLRISKEYGTGQVNWEGYEEVKATSWQRQLHLFEVPFYYIEYAFAQLGALGVWKNSKTDLKAAVNNYKEALKLGYTKSIPEIYKTAGVKFDFSDNYLSEIANFVGEELKAV
ncbi:oligoendopeptidase F [Lishizhenia tianjinensis]|uniref:Oligoendopeptidase F n=1 Tax=Lishizhenia tianjinensis TaxID=477690 RepID=A0A1I6YVI0_9FLAO|nr:M3 family oligoendopeptidase [Lishizhenia tianjinensis]SFT54427.1 oligoendopeptidase F [Lishizhenia tianjinensis]